MKKHNLFLVLVLMASIMTPIVNAQWQEAFPLTSQMNGFYFTDSLHGWFTHESLDRIIHTSDGGYTFTIQPTPNGLYGLRDIYMESNQVGWAGGDNNGGPGRVLRTTNGGATWVNMTHPAPNSAWNALAKAGNTMWFVGGYAADQGIIMKTSNNGASWQVNLYPEMGTLIDIKVLDEQNVLICGKQAIHRTTDAGLTWLPVFVHPNPDFWFTALAFVNNTLGYALGNIAMTGKTYLYRTTDAGFTWNMQYDFADNAQKNALSVIPSTGTIFVAGGYNNWLATGILKSTNGGTTWDFFPTNYLITSHIYTPTPYQGWAGAGSMIYRYDYVEPPVVQPIPNAFIQLGEAFQYQVQAQGMGLKYSMFGNPAGLSIGQYSGLISGTPSYGGNFWITVAVKDTDFNVVNAQFNLRVNRPPVFIPPFPPTHAWVDSLYQFQLRVEEADDDSVIFQWLTKPTWLTFLSEGITSTWITGVPSVNDTGYHQIAVLASDGLGGSDTLSWVLEVRNYTVLSVNLQADWNLVSVPLTTNTNILGNIYPYIGNAYWFNGVNYQPTATFALGAGYWAKFATNTTCQVTGAPLPQVTITVNAGWNMIGSVDHVCSVPTGEIITSQFWGFNGSYVPETTLVPGKAYWVKTSQAGELTLGAGQFQMPAITTPSATLYVTDAASHSQSLLLFREANLEWYAMPPFPPQGAGFDVRFASQRAAELLPAGSDSVYQLWIRASSYPLQFLWEADSTIASALLVIYGSTYPLVKGEYLQINTPFTQALLKVNVVTSVEPISGIPTEFKLEQNYPNPFNTSTIISWQSPISNWQTIKLYDIIGREIETIVDGYYEAGSHSTLYIVNSTLPSGVYFYQLTAGEYKETKKMILNK